MMTKSTSAFMAATILASAVAADTSAANPWEDWSTTTSSLVVDPKPATTTSSVDPTWVDWTTTTTTTSAHCGTKTTATVITGTNTANGKVYSYTKDVVVDTCPTSSAVSDEYTWADWTTTTTTSAHCGPTTTSTVVTGTNTANGKVYSYTKPITIDTCPTSSTTSDEYTWADWTTTTSAHCGPTTTSTVITGTNTANGKVYSYTKPITINTCPTATTTKKTTVDNVPTSSAVYWGDWSSVVDPVDGSCGVSTLTYDGEPVYLPEGTTTFGGWTLSGYSIKTIFVEPVTTSTSEEATWADWTTTTSAGCGPKATITVITGTEGAKTYSYTKTITVDTCKTTTKAATTTADSTWADWESTSSPVTTKAPTTTKAPEPKPTTTTTKAPAPKATCPADNGKTVLAGGSCGCGFEVNCGVRATPDASTKFWEKNAGEKVATLAECNARCDANDKCEATLWVDDSTSGDYHLCWEISGLGAPTGTGIAQISYKKSCSGKCSASYSK